ncbi:sugar ABC transporter permease [Deinococcus roseus]|uniref:ABC transporter permease n=1 Tax=Deinococcus roseus TaxID=392414 RepID=A0ABQ2DDA0_9DEIO|nr:ABC transporter permease subunit [Deinococcus roseus]GGJ53628.1 ABC transporter permease [Deinococcus roseus]
MNRSSHFGMTVTYLVLIVAVVFFAAPIALVLSVSLSDKDSIVAGQLQLIPRHPTFENYSVIFTPTFLRDLMNSVIYAGGTALFSLVVGTSAAYALSRMKFRGRTTINRSFILLQAFPGVLTLIPLYVMFLKFHLLNSYQGMILAYAAGTLPFTIAILKSYFDTIPRALEEAAFIDGATQGQTFLRIVLPLSLPALAITALMGFNLGWTEFILAYSLLSTEEMYSLAMRLYGMLGQFTTSWSEFAAMSVVIALPITVMFLRFEKYLVSGLTMGGVKE